MKNLMRSALLLLLAAGAANAQFEGVAEMKISTTGAHGEVMMNGTGKTYVSKVGWRSEMEMASPDTAKMTGGKPFRMVMLGKLANPDVVYSVNDAMKTYAVINTKEMKELAGKIEKQEKKFTVTKLGKDSVAGLSCENVRVTEDKGGQNIEACISREFMSGEWMRALQRDSRGGDWMKALRDNGVEGYPVRLTMTMKDQPGMKTAMEIVKVDRHSVPASMFTVPAGYKETSMMGNFAQTPEQAKQMEDAQKQLQKAMENMTPEQRKMIEEMMKKQAPKGQ
ncbi:MAG TPA: DUF4412 domain-containing protein [Thermoanaerobaculia bacterium]|nr:DUF4412 domain-containing protein [Thermoanaerobaculia bacterium]HQR68683.1 DUF4412 domain-containing protein [Thermoanaerobaculia bacterium]